jgi:hypothetical protein
MESRVVNHILSGPDTPPPGEGGVRKGAVAGKKTGTVSEKGSLLFVHLLWSLHWWQVTGPVVLHN